MTQGVGRRWAVRVATALVASVLGPAAGAVPLPQAPGCPMLPADSHWHADVSGLPVHPSSGAYVASAGPDGPLHPDFGSGLWEGGPIGIPYVTVAGNQTRVPVTFDYDDESDPGPYPIPADAPVEGGADSDGDRHVLVVDRDACRLYELFDAHRQSNGSWHAGSGAVFDLRSNALRPAGWTSADAAGLPILPGLVRYDEVAGGEIDHAIRITINATDARYVWPARHQAGSSNPSRAPMGLRLRLKASVDISGFPPPAQVILRALKKHGAIVADNGSSWFISGAPDERWDNDALRTLRRIHGSDFEAVDASSLMAHPDSGQVRGGTATPPPGAGLRPGATPAPPRVRPAPPPSPTTVPAPIESTTTATERTTTTSPDATADEVARPRRSADEGAGVDGVMIAVALALLLGVGALAAVVRRRAKTDG